jgi:hypothetical protein
LRLYANPSDDLDLTESERKRKFEWAKKQIKKLWSYAQRWTKEERSELNFFRNKYSLFLITWLCQFYFPNVWTLDPFGLNIYDSWREFRMQLEERIYHSDIEREALEELEEDRFLERMYEEYGLEAIRKVRFVKRATEPTEE